MEPFEKIIAKIKQDKIVPLFYHQDTQVCINVVKTLYCGGISCVEFTNRGPEAFKNFSTMVEEKNKGMQNLFLGAGTIMNAQQAVNFIKAGADFLISPFFDEEINFAAKENNILYIPGCMTPGEINVARKGGCKFVKLFPGNVLGTGFVEAIKPVFAEMEFLVTGGVSTQKDNIEGWLRSGVSAVGLGSKLITAEILESRDYEGLEKGLSKVMGYIKD